MIVICEECGKKYRIDASKIKGTAARFKCRVCTHMIMVSKPQSASTAAAVADFSTTITEVGVDEHYPTLTLARPLIYSTIGRIATARAAAAPINFSKIATRLSASTWLNNPNNAPSPTSDETRASQNSDVLIPGFTSISFSLR